MMAASPNAGVLFTRANISLKNDSNATTKDSSNPDNASLSGVEVFTFLVFCSLLALVIIFGNILVVAAYRSNSRLRTKANLFLVSLAISDCLVGVVSLPLWMCIQILYIPSSSVFHVLFICCDIFSALTSVFHLTAISAERFVAVSRPLHYASLSFTYYKITLAIAWTSSALTAALYRVAQLYGFMEYYVPCVLFIGFLGPLIIIASMYGNIFNIARTLIQREPGTEDRSPSNGGKPSKKNLKKERKVAVTVSIITGLFFVAWLPYYVVLMLTMFCGMPCFLTYASLLQVIAFSKWMHYLNSAVNAFVYAFRDREMRRTFARLLGNRCAASCVAANQYETPSSYL